MKVVTILGTRPEIIRLSETIKILDNVFEHVLIHTGQNYDYELNEVFFKELGLRKPDYFLNCAGRDLGETMGNIIAQSYRVLAELKPDAVLILGDTNSALSAISAKRLKLPIFHMEAGNRCWDWNVSEMINRKVVDAISDINLPYTENSRRYLMEEGIDPKTIFVTGSPMKEVLTTHKMSIDNSSVLKDLGLIKEKYILLSSHREENIDIEENFYELMNSINSVAKESGLPLIYSLHPRAKKWIEKRNFKFDPLVRTIKPLGFFDYCHLQQNAYCVLSDSGTLSEESAILNFPAVLIRTSTERPEALDAGTIVLGGISSSTIKESMIMSVKLKDQQPKMNKDYDVDDVSLKVAKIIQSYANIVKKTTWGQ